MPQPPNDRAQDRKILSKTSTDRVVALRAARDALGLRRLELYAHPDDWPAIKALAEKLHLKRSKAPASTTKLKEK